MSTDGGFRRTGAGFKDLPPVHLSHPQTTPPEAAAQILELSEANPTRGCNWLHDWPLPQGTRVSAPAIQNIPNKNNMGSR